MDRSEQNIPLSSIDGWEKLLNMTEDEARAHLDTALAKLSFEDQAEVLRRLDRPQ